MSVTSCLLQHFSAKSPIAAYRADMAADVAELVAEGMGTEAAWLQVADAKLADLKAERTRIEQSVADAYGKTAAGKPAAPAVAPQEAPKRTESRGTAKHPRTVMGSRILAIVSKSLDGLDPAWIAEFSHRQETKARDKNGRPRIEWRNPLIPGVGRLFRRGGTQDLQLLAEALEETGYLPPGSVEADAKEAGETAKQIVRDALNRAEAQTQDEIMAERQAEFERRGQEETDDYAGLDPESAAEAEEERAAIMAANNMAPVDAAALDDDDVAFDAQPTAMSMVDGMRSMGFTEQEIEDAVAQEAAKRQAQGGPAEAVQDASQGPRAAAETGAAQAQPAGDDEGLTLEAQTPADLKAKADREEAATKAQAAKKLIEQTRLRKEAEARDNKARADQSVNDFQLGQSADQQMSGMGDMFADAPVEAAGPAAQDAGNDKAAQEAAPGKSKKSERLTDAGEELIRNRRGKLKGLAWDDVSAMNDTLKVAQVVKGNVWPRPDYAKMVEDGAPAWKAAAFKAVYDKLAAAPVTRAAPTDADLRAYIETLQQVREALAAELDRVETLGGAGDLWKTLSSRNVFGAVFPIPADARPVYGTPSPFDRKSEQGKENNRRALLIGGNAAVQALQFGYKTTSKIKDLLAEGFPAKQEAWQKSYEARQTETRDSDVPEAERTGQPQQRFYVYEKGSRWRLAKGGQDGGYATQEMAEAFARTLVAKKRETLPPSRGLDLADAKRTGPDWRGGKDVTAEQVMAHFGFRGVNLGEYVKAKQGVAQLHLNHAYDAFGDLADLLGVPPRAMSLNGTLGVAIGAQGSGKALAHFVPGVNEINITRDSGAGALAHEFGHAADHYFATQHGRAASMAKRPYLSAVVENIGDAGGVRPEVMDAMRAVMKTLNSRAMTEAEARKYLNDQRELNQRRMDRWVKEFSGNKGADAAALSAVAEKLKRGEVGEAQDTDVETNLAEFMRAAGLKPGNAIAGNAFSVAYRLRDLADEARFLASHIPQVDTDYAKASAAMDAKKQGDGYWSTPWEKFARAFETFAMDALRDRQRESLYLSGLVDSEGWASWSAETGKAIPYPAGAERLEMQQAFQRLVDTIQTRTDDAGSVAMYEAEPEYDAQARRTKYQDDQQADLFSQQLDAFLNAEPDPSQKGDGVEAARQEAADALRILRRDATLLGRAVAGGLAENQRASLVGQVARTPEDLATLAQVYRDPRFETFRVVFTGAGSQVVAQAGLTSRLPGSTAAIVGNDLEGYLTDLFAAAQRAGASGFYMLHNHPSGNPTPSRADEALTGAFVGREIPGVMAFKGHVVIDTNSYSVIDRDGASTEYDKDFGAPEPAADAGGWSRFTITGPEDVMAMAKTLEATDDAVTLIVLDYQHRVRQISSMPAAAVTASKTASALAVRRAILRGLGAKVIAVSRNQGALDLLASKHGLTLDAIHITADGRAVSFANLGIVGAGNALPATRSTRVTADTSKEFDYLRPLAMQANKRRNANRRAAEPEAKFSRSTGSNGAVSVWKNLAKSDDLFRLAKSSEKSFSDIAAEVAPDLSVAEEDVTSDPDYAQAWSVYPVGADGKPIKARRGYVFRYKDGSVEVNLEKFTEGDGGWKVYGLAGNYAFNNDLVFNGDRLGISDEGMERRLEHMISLALKFGTTDFLAPHPYQLRDLGFDWRAGDTDYNLGQMLNASHRTLSDKFPAIKDLVYDFATGDFKSLKSGRVVNERGIADLVVRARAAEARVGPASIQRAAVTNAGLRGEAPANWRAVRGRDADGSPESLDSSLVGIQYSRSTGRGVPMKDANAVAQAVREALPTAPQIILHESVNQAPQALRDAIRDAGAENDVEAAYHDGAIHVFPQHMESIERMAFVVGHHEIRHHGLRSILGPRLGTVLLGMHQSNPSLRAAAQAKIDEGLTKSRVEAIEEALADMPVEELAKLSGWDKIVTAARQWLRNLAAKLRRTMPNLADAIDPQTWTDRDVAAMVMRAENVSRGGSGPFRTGGTVFQRVWHGTPYRGIDKFSTDAIGTGEGAQAYGYGLYFASRREVADFYRRKLSGESDRVFTKDGRTIQGPADLAEAYYQPGRIVRGYGGADKVLEFKRTDGFGWSVKVIGVKANGDPMNSERPRWHATQPDGNTLRDVLEEGGWKPSHAGQLYEVEVPEDSEMLNWDKPLSEQPANVRAALIPFFDRYEQNQRRVMSAFAAADVEREMAASRKTITGQGIYEQAGYMEGGDRNASEHLRGLGILGIKYLDGTSRDGKGNGHNYVIFSGDDAAITGTMFSRTSIKPDWVSGGSAALQAAAGKIDTYAPTKTIAEKAREMSAGWKGKLVQGMLDAYAPLKSLSMDAYIAARMTKAADGAFEGMLMYGKPEMTADGGITGNLDGKGFLGAMRELNGEHDRFFMWLAGNRAERLLKEGRENLFTADEIAAMKTLSAGTMADGRARNVAFSDALTQFSAYNKSVLDVAEKAGLIDGESRKLWEHDFYVPFYRMSEENEISGPTKIKGLARQKAFEKLKGGKENLGDLMDNTLRNWSHLLSASLANVAASKSLLAAEGVGIAIEAKESQAKEMAKAMGIKGNATYFMDQGVQRWFIVEDPAVLQAVSALEAPALNGLPLQLMAKFKKYLTIGVTIAPAFKVRNLIRDTLAAPAANEMSFNVAKNLAQGWKATDTKTAGYAQMLFGGGLMRFGTYLEGDRAEHVKRLIADGVDDKTILNTPQKVKAMLGKAWDAWQDFGDRLENVNRTALYQQLLANGMSPREAAFQARDMMDFSLQGSWAAMRTLTAVVPFLNARAQGLYKLGRAAAENPRRMGYMVAAVSLASIALMLANEDDEDWKAREDWDRDAYWWIKVGDIAYRIPKPFEVGAMGTIAERSVELLMNDEMTGARFAERMKQMVTGTFAINPVPQLFKPMLDLYANKDSFTGRQIETLGMERLSKPERYGPNTSGFAKAMGAAGEYTGISPVQVDHMIRAYFGWLGTMGVATVDAATSPFSDTINPTKKIDDYFGGFVKELPAAPSRYLEDFYEQAKATSEAMADLRRAREAGDTEKAADILQDRGDKIALSRLYQHAQTQIGDINRRIRLVRDSSTMDADTKKQRLDDLAALRNRLARTVSIQTRAREAALQ